VSKDTRPPRNATPRTRKSRKSAPVPNRPAAAEAVTATDLFRETTPADALLLETSRSHWQYGQWEKLAAIDIATLSAHPDRAKLALLAAAGQLQAGAPGAARQALRQARDWGANRGLTARVLAAGLHNTLGRISVLLDDAAGAAGHFRASIALVEPGADAELLGRTRQLRETARLGLTREAAAAMQAELDGLAAASATPAEIMAQLAVLQEALATLDQVRLAAPGTPPATEGSQAGGPADAERLAEQFLASRKGMVVRLGPILDRLLQLPKLPSVQAAGSPDIVAMIERLDAILADPVRAPEAIDAASAALSPRDGALFLMIAAAHRAETKDRMLALDLMADAEDMLPPDAGAQGLLTIGAEIYTRLSLPQMALSLLARDMLQGPGALAPGLRMQLDKAIRGSADKGDAEHGHVVLMEWLTSHPPVPGKRLMVEIGTTRERVPGQGSTEKLARFCSERGFDFVTVDMDPRNAARAQRLFGRLGLPFRAVAAKGEDWLAAFEGTVDYIFLDAYDYDHGKHSETRQVRYETFLGSRIDEEACHKMHLDCAHVLVDKLALDGLICFDDTWTDAEGRWTAKGTTAMPFLLANGFHVLEARNRAALLARD